MKLAFSGQGRYPDYDAGYELYKKRVRKQEVIDETTYARIVRTFCKRLAERLYEEGMVDLPNGMGTISAATITRKPQYRGKKFIGFGGMDWKNKRLDGTLKTFGMVFLPKHGKNDNLRCFGYVANRQLFKRMKARYLSGDCPWSPLTFNDEMV